MNNTAALEAYIIKTQPKVIFWDLGKVIIDIDVSIENELTPPHFGISYQQYIDTINSYYDDFIV